MITKIEGTNQSTRNALSEVENLIIFYILKFTLKTLNKSFLALYESRLKLVMNYLSALKDGPLKVH